MIRAALNLLTSPVNRSKMAIWKSKVDDIIGKPPGSDEGFSQDYIAICAKVNFSKMSTWAIICEEMLDTQHPRIYFEKAHEELRKRKIDESEINEMRGFAWLTAGWLNFEMMLWDWTSLDEKDIYRAIDLQYTHGWISTKEKSRRVEFAKKYDRALSS